MDVEPEPNNMGQKKLKYYWEHLREQVGNILGTHWEQRSQKKNPPPPVMQ